MARKRQLPENGKDSAFIKLVEGPSNTTQDKRITWPAGIGHDDVHEIEDKFKSDAHGVNRRILWVILTMNSEKLFKDCEDDPETWFEIFRATATTIGTYRRVLSLMDTAHNRLSVKLAEVDCQAPDALFSEQDFFAAIDKAKAEDINEKEIWPALRLVSDAGEGGEL